MPLLTAPRLAAWEHKSDASRSAHRLRFGYLWGRQTDIHTGWRADHESNLGTYSLSRSIPSLRILTCFWISIHRMFLSRSSPPSSTSSSAAPTETQPSSSVPSPSPPLEAAIASSEATKASWIYAKLKSLVIPAIAVHSSSGKSISSLSLSFFCQYWQYRTRSSSLGLSKKYFLSKRDGRCLRVRTVVSWDVLVISLRNYSQKCPGQGGQGGS